MCRRSETAFGASPTGRYSTLLMPHVPRLGECLAAASGMEHGVGSRVTQSGRRARLLLTSSSAPRSLTHSRRSSLSWPEPECNCITNKGAAVRELLGDFITSLDGYASGEGWPGWWGLQGPEYLAWLEKQPEVTYLMGANT
jgi:hypothetical protein